MPSVHESPRHFFEAGSIERGRVCADGREELANRLFAVDTLAAVRGIIDSLAYAKCNVLHWHMSDTQSFPFQSKTMPKLWDGAYSPQEKYTQADIAMTVEYARERSPNAEPKSGRENV